MTTPARPRRRASVANSSPRTASRPPSMTSTSPGEASASALNTGRWSSSARTVSAGPANRTSGTIARIAGSTTGMRLSASHSADTSISSRRRISSTARDPTLRRMPRIAFIGAGSTVFTRNLIRDVLSLPELADDTTFALMDIDPQRLKTSTKVADQLVRGTSSRVEAMLDRREALNNADYVVTSFQVGGLEASKRDFEIPKRYGLRQTIADTLGVGGISRAMRTIPVLLDVTTDMEELCPDALLLQYVNPMAMLCWAVAERSPIRTVGLCHSVQHTTGELADDLGIPASEIDAHVAGINHLAFFLRLQRAGEDLYPALREVEPPETNRVRYEVLRHFG